MTLLLTGGAGFIGQHLLTELLRQQAQVIVLDNFSSGDKAYFHANFKGNVRLLEQDVVDPLPALPALSGIYHLACPASLPTTSKIPSAR